MYEEFKVALQLLGYLLLLLLAFTTLLVSHESHELHVLLFLFKFDVLMYFIVVTGYVQSSHSRTLVVTIVAIAFYRLLPWSLWLHNTWCYHGYHFTGRVTMVNILQVLRCL